MDELTTNSPAMTLDAAGPASTSAAVARPQPAVSPLASWMGGTLDERMEFVTNMMREVSLQTEPAAMVDVYGGWMKRLIKIDRRVSLSRRGLEYPFVRVTRSELDAPLNPWENTASLPVIKGGLLAELIWTEKPIVMNDLVVPADDPTARYFEVIRPLTNGM